MKKRTKLLLLAAMMALLSSCGLKSGDELLAAPRPTKNFVALQNELDGILATGALYSSPESGQNRNTVQLIDLDGDGTDEAISFFRESAMSDQFMVYVHKKIGDEYIQMGWVAGRGTAIESVDYPALTPDGKRGIVIAWRQVGENDNELTVCAFEGLRLFTVLETRYTAFALSDMTGDGSTDLTTLHIDAQGRKYAALYGYTEGAMPLIGETNLSSDAKSIARVTAGYAGGRLPAIYVEERNESGTGLMTDIVVYDEGSLHNIAMEGEQSETSGTYRPVSVYASDIDGDGITEVPQATLAPGHEGGTAEAQYFLDWIAYGRQENINKRTTYQNQLEEWMLHVPEAWRGQVTVTRLGASTDVSETTFSLYLPEGDSIPLLRIYCLTGELRQYFAATSGNFRLHERLGTVYAAQIPQEGQETGLAPTQEEVEAWFSVISQDWSR